MTYVILLTYFGSPAANSYDSAIWTGIGGAISVIWMIDLILTTHKTPKVGKTRHLERKPKKDDREVDLEEETSGISVLKIKEESEESDVGKEGASLTEEDSK